MFLGIGYVTNICNFDYKLFNMNTVKIGDEFENKSYDIIEHALNNHELGIIPAFCKIYRKRKYYHIYREKEIIFDLAIEVITLGADKPTNLYIIECKDYSNHNVPVDDLEEFLYKIKGIKGFSPKGIVIANSKFQSGALKTAQNTGVMLIEVDEDDYKIILHKNERQNRQSSELDNIDLKIRNIIEEALLPKEIHGLKKLSTNKIDKIACDFLNEYDTNILNYALPTPLPDIANFLKEKYSLAIKFSFLTDRQDVEVLGYYDVKNNQILIHDSLIDSPRFPFVLAHEIGHFVLHKDLKINQVVYNNFKDSHFNSLQQSFTNRNPKNWIEWQANCFGASLLMPKSSILARLIGLQLQMGISKQGTIYLDNQDCNKIAYREIVQKLAEFFCVSKINIEYRLNDLGFIKKAPPKKEDNDSRELLREISKLNSKSNY